MGYMKGINVRGAGSASGTRLAALAIAATIGSDVVRIDANGSTVTGATKASRTWTDTDAYILQVNAKTNIKCVVLTLGAVGSDDGSAGHWGHNGPGGNQVVAGDIAAASTLFQDIIARWKAALRSDIRLIVHYNEPGTSAGGALITGIWPRATNVAAQRLTPASLTAVGTAATLVLTAGSYAAFGIGTTITIAGAADAAFNGTFAIETWNSGTNTATFTLGSAPAGLSTGAYLYPGWDVVDKLNTLATDLDAQAVSLGYELWGPSFSCTSATLINDITVANACTTGSTLDAHWAQYTGLTFNFYPSICSNASYSVEPNPRMTAKLTQDALDTIFTNLATVFPGDARPVGCTETGVQMSSNGQIAQTQVSTITKKLKGGEKALARHVQARAVTLLNDSRVAFMIWFQACGTATSDWLRTGTNNVLCPYTGEISYSAQALGRCYGVEILDSAVTATERTPV